MGRRAEAVISHVRPKLLGRMTQRAVVEALNAAGPLSRMDIARRTGISATTVSGAVGHLVEAGYVEDDARHIDGPGRPRQLLRLATASQVIGVGIETDWCELAAGGLDGKPAAGRHARFPTPDTYPALLAAVERHARGWMTGHPGRTLGLGMSLPGVIDPTGQRAVFSPNLHQTDDQRPADDLAAPLGLPVTAGHEMDNLCLAERRGRRVDELAVIDHSSGLGVGILTGGRPLSRRHGLPLELGHVTVAAGGDLCGCGNRGCLETVATDAAFARRAAATAGRPLTRDEAFAAALATPGRFAADLAATLDGLATAVAAVVNLFAPPLVVLHGQLLDLAPDALDRLQALAATRCLPPFRDRLQLTRAGATKATGAMAAVLEQLFESLGPLPPAADSAG